METTEKLLIGMRRLLWGILLMLVVMAGLWWHGLYVYSCPVEGEEAEVQGVEI